MKVKTFSFLEIDVFKVQFLNKILFLCLFLYLERLGKKILKILEKFFVSLFSFMRGARALRA